MAAAGGAPPMRAAEAAPAVRRNVKRKASDHAAAVSKTYHTIAQSPLFNSLVAAEKQLDAVLKRRRLEAADAEGYNQRAAPKTLRLYLFHTHQLLKGGRGGQDVPSWCFNIAGRVLDPWDADNQPQPANTPPHTGGPIHMTQYLNKVDITLTPTTPSSSNGATAAAAAGATTPAGTKQPAPAAGAANSVDAGGDFAAAGAVAAGGGGGEELVQVDGVAAVGPGSRVTWINPGDKAAYKDLLQVHGSGTQSMKVKVRLDVDWAPRRYRAPPGLAQLLGVQYDSKARLMGALWAYIIKHQLVSKEDPSQVVLDAPLSKVLGCPRLALGSLAEAVYKVLLPMQPLEVEYTMDLSGPSPSTPLCYDIRVTAPIVKKAAVLTTPAVEAQLAENEAGLNSLLSRLAERVRRRTFFMGFAARPHEFINALIASQARDLHVSSFEAGSVPNLVALRRSEHFKGPWVTEALLRHIEQARQQVPRAAPVAAPVAAVTTAPAAAVAAAVPAAGLAAAGVPMAAGVGPGAAGVVMAPGAQAQAQAHAQLQQQMLMAAQTQQQFMVYQQQQQQQQQHQVAAFQAAQAAAAQQQQHGHRPV